MTKDQKIRSLLQDSKKLYHTQDLAVLWGINNPDTLYNTIQRYIKRGFLNKIYKGFYSTVSLKEIDPFYLGIRGLNRYAYVSTESILVQEGIIFQEIKYITLVSDISKRFQIGNHHFLVRKMKDEYLHNETGIIEKKGVRFAYLERAIFDLLYFNPKYHFDKKVNWEKVKKIKNEIIK